MFLLRNASGKHITRVACQHGNHRLQHHRPAIQFFSDKMYAHAMLLFARFQHALVGVGAAVERQQGWVNVQHAAGIVADEGRTEYAHEARQHHQRWRETINFRH